MTNMSGRKRGDALCPTNINTSQASNPAPAEGAAGAAPDGVPFDRPAWLRPTAIEAIDEYNAFKRRGWEWPCRLVGRKRDSQ